MPKPGAVALRKMAKPPVAVAALKMVTLAQVLRLGVFQKETPLGPVLQIRIPQLARPPEMAIPFSDAQEDGPDDRAPPGGNHSPRRPP